MVRVRGRPRPASRLQDQQGRRHSLLHPAFVLLHSGSEGLADSRRPHPHPCSGGTFAQPTNAASASSMNALTDTGAWLSRPGQVSVQANLSSAAPRMLRERVSLRAPSSCWLSSAPLGWWAAEPGLSSGPGLGCLHSFLCFPRGPSSRDRSRPSHTSNLTFLSVCL